MKKIMKTPARLLALALIVVMLAGCSPTATTPEPASNDPGTTADNNTEQQPAAASDEPYILKFPTFQIGVNTAAPFIAEAVKQFNEIHAGKIEVQIEEVPGDQAYLDKMKVLLAADQLPEVVFAGGYNLLDMAVEKDAVIDLTPYLEEDPYWAAGFSEAALDFNSRNGKVYSIPPQTDLIGYFYNKEMFAAAGVTPATTWDEFFVVCQKLQDAGFTPLSMDTADSGWVTSLWMMAMVGTASSAGESFASQMFPENYNIPEFINAIGNIQDMFQNYTTLDAVGGYYEHAANNFLSGQTAMIANGAWMIGDFSDEDVTGDAGFADKVGVAIYPGNGVFDSANLGYFVTATDPVAQRAAVEFVKFITGPEMGYLSMQLTGNLPANLHVEFTDEDKAENPLLADLLELSKSAQFRFNYHQAIWFPNTVDQISMLYPSLAMGDMTPEEFAARLTETAEKN